MMKAKLWLKIVGKGNYNMFSALRELLNSELKPFGSQIKEISAVSQHLTDPRGNVFSDLPDFVRVTAESSFGEGSYIRHEIWLPADWNGCFMGTGNGGMAGNIDYGALIYYTKVGRYATANTDMGTSRGVAQGVKNSNVQCDFGWRATYIMTAIGKLITRAYYKKEIDKSYFIGCSTGGEQALAMAQRCPDEYDGIVAGVPANNRTNLHTYFLWTYNAMKKSGAVFTREELERVTQSAVLFSKQTGLSDPADQFVSNPRATEEYINAFIDYLSRNNTELSQAKLELLKTIYMGPVNPRTKARIYCGLPIGSEFKECGIWEMQHYSQSPHFYPFQWTFGEDYNGDNFDFDKDLDSVNQTLASNMNANETDISPFLKRGGKLFIFSASADPCVPFPDAMKYYDRVVATLDEETRALDSVRYFLLPGQGHAAGVNKFGQVLMNGDIPINCNSEVIRTWREKGIAPDSFDMIVSSDQNGAVRKTIYAYGTDKNPSIDYPVCDGMYLV